MKFQIVILAVFLTPGLSMAKKVTMMDAIFQTPTACDSLDTVVRASGLSSSNPTAEQMNEFNLLMNNHCFDIKLGTGVRELSRNNSFVEIALYTNPASWNYIGTF
jgi:hypothetical protein